MTCRAFIAFLSDYFSASLSACEREQFESHLADCPDCAAYLTSYQYTITLGKAAFRRLDEDVPSEVPEELVQAILAVRVRHT